MTASEKYAEVLTRYRKVVNEATQKRDEVYLKLQDAKRRADELHDAEIRDVVAQHAEAEAAMMAERQARPEVPMKPDGVATIAERELPDGN